MKSRVPETVLQKLEGYSGNLARLVHDVRKASEPQSIAKAERALSTVYLLSPGLGFQAKVTPEEEVALSNMLRGTGYEEPKAEG